MAAEEKARFPLQNRTDHLARPRDVIRSNPHGVEIICERIRKILRRSKISVMDPGDGPEHVGDLQNAEPLVATDCKRVALGCGRFIETTAV